MHDQAEYVAELEDSINRLQKRLRREKDAKRQAEELLERKSQELYSINRNLHQHAKLMEAAIVNAKDGVIITKANLDNGGPEIVYVNHALTRISGYEADELIGKTPRIFQGAGTNRQVLDDMKNTLLRGKSYKGEILNYTKDGIAYWLDISVTPVMDEDGKITHFAAIERDITSRKAFEKEMQVNREAAEVANRVKGDFLANMSHELRTPMNGIIGLSELMIEATSQKEDASELAEAINTSSRNLLILLNDILDLSKIEAGELTLENIAFNSRRSIRQTIELLKPMADKKAIYLECDIDENVPARIMADPARLQQIMNNLISNAIKFTDAGYVRLGVSTTKDYVGDPQLSITVEDTGIGIPEDKRDLVFKKFMQADVSTARKYGGTGLGLAITKELVEMMGGTIRLESEVGAGTTFFIDIPIEIPEIQSISENNGKEEKSLASIDTSKRLLVVDDHPVNLLFMRKVLDKIGFKMVDQASSGVAALELVHENPYDLIFMDCQMPEMDGFESSERIRLMEGADIGTIPIIAVTADAMKGARERCIDAGMNDYISKPVDVEKLRDVLRKWLLRDDVEAVDDIQVNDVITQLEAESEADKMVVDWDRIAMFTDGNAEEEKELIDMFILYADETLQILNENRSGGTCEVWQKAAHKLKGSAANLGAKTLSDVCYKAEKASDADNTVKDQLFGAITHSYKQVCDILLSHRA